MIPLPFTVHCFADIVGDNELVPNVSGGTTPIIVDFRINETLQIGAVGNSAYQTWGAKVFIYFLNLL